MQSTEHIAPIVGRAINHATARPTARRLECTTEQYFADNIGELVPTLNQSTATEILNKSPLHAWLHHPKGGGRRRRTTEAMTTGSLVHSLLLDGGKGLTVLDFADYRTKAAQAARDAAIAARTTPVLASKVEEGKWTAKVLREKLLARGVDLAACEPEVKVVWTEPTPHGVITCRAMMDAVDWTNGIVYDLKTADSVKPQRLERSLLEYGYDIQAHAYPRALDLLVPELAGRWVFKWLAVEVDEPHAVTVAHPDGVVRQVGSQRWADACADWARCLSTRQWPEYAESEIALTLPSWAAREQLEGETERESDAA